MTAYIDLPLSGLEAPLSEMEQLVQDTCHRFAEEVLRPAGPMMDEMTAEEAVAPDSPLWRVLEQAQGLGLSVKDMLEMDPPERERLLLIAAEELAWGDGGLAGMILVNQMPALYSALAGNMNMVEYCDGKLGCWGITEPDHGSDTLDHSGSLQAVDGHYGRPNCVARIEGDKIVVNGQKSAWVSGAITAQVCALYCHVEENGKTRPGVVAIVPLDLPGVSRGKPLEKLGLRSLNQGELYFDNVEVPISHLLAGPDGYADMVYHTLAEANVHVANLAVGTARAAYEHALAYAQWPTSRLAPRVRPTNMRWLMRTSANRAGRRSSGTKACTTVCSTCSARSRRPARWFAGSLITTQRPGCRRCRARSLPR
jgi:alkylation response protein AidB-like acyl-CoA dehydrogenase